MGDKLKMVRGEKDILVSVVIPVYNAESYLTRTLDTVKTQTYSNIEVLLIDDGSTDKSAQICDEYAEKDNRFRVYHIANAGVANARNFALDNLSGEYCIFVDSDDIIKPNYIEAMLGAALSHEANLVICRFMSGFKYSEDDFLKMDTTTFSQGIEVTFNEYRFTNKYRHLTVWAALYKVTLLKGLKFDSDLHVGEDTFFFAECLNRSRKLIFLNEMYYYYTFRENSLYRGGYNENRHTEIESWQRICELFVKEEKSFVNECYTALALRCKKNYLLAIKSNNARLAKELYLLGVKHIKNVIISKEIRFGKKIMFLGFVCFPHVFAYKFSINHELLVYDYIDLNHE